MHLSIARHWLAASCLVLLAACGGGGGAASSGSGGGSGEAGSGGSGGDTGTTVTSPDSSLSLQAFNTTMTVNQFASDNLLVIGTLASRPGTGPLYVDIEESNSTFSIYQLSGSGLTFATTLNPGKWLQPGHHDGTLTFKICQTRDCSAPFAGYSATVPYSVTVQPPPGEQHRLQPSALSVAFADTPTGAVLSRTLWIHDNFNTAAAWSATTDVSWLTVTPNGTADASNLVISADPALLPLGQTSVATVRVTAAGVSGATINVGVWRDADGVGGAVQMGIVPDVEAHPVTGMARDPYRPLVYVSVGTGQILVYNAHTASLERTIDNVGTQLGALAVAPDGAHLYASDGRYADSIRVVDLVGNGPVQTWTPARSAGDASLLVVHPDSEDVVLIGNGDAMAHGTTITGPVFEGVPILSGHLAATDDGRVVYSTGSGKITEWLVDYSSATDELLEFVARSTDLGEYQFSAGQITVSGDGDRLYFVDERAATCAELDPLRLTLISRLQHPEDASQPYGVAMGDSGNVACAYYGVVGADVRVFASTGATFATFANLPGNGYNSHLVTTADGQISVGVAGATLMFVPMGTPSSTIQASALARTRPR